MDAEALADILHLMFEEDFVESASQSPEAASRKDGIRKILYEQIYDRPYRIWAGQGQNASRIPETAHGFDGENDYEDLDEQLERLAEQQVRAPRPTKPYMPPTPMQEGRLPFGDVLDAPMGG